MQGITDLQRYPPTLDEMSSVSFHPQTYVPNGIEASFVTGSFLLKEWPQWSENKFKCLTKPYIRNKRQYKNKSYRFVISFTHRTLSDSEYIPR